jgi:tight adherence protein B
MSVIIALLAFAMVVGVGWALAAMATDRHEKQQALANRLSTMAGATAATGASGPLLKDQRLSGIPLLDAVLGNVPFVRPLVQMIEQAGLRRRVGEVLLYVVLLFLIVTLLTALLGGGRLAAILFGTLAAAVPLLVVARMRQKRTHLFAEQLPDALDLVRAALQAGHGFVAACGVVAETFADPVAQEFRYLCEEVRLGLPFRDALLNLTQRVPDENLPILVVGILTAQEVGGNLAEVVDNIAHTIRERAKLQREIRSMTAQGRLSGGVLTALPFFVGSAMMVFNPTYFKPMLEETAGHYMMLYVVVSIITGHFVIRRIVRMPV